MGLGLLYFWAGGRVSGNTQVSDVMFVRICLNIISLRSVFFVVKNGQKNGWIRFFVIFFDDLVKCIYIFKIFSREF